MSKLASVQFWFSNFLCLISSTVVLIGLSNDWNVLQLGGPFLELPLILCAGIVLFLNEGYQVGILGVRYLSNISPDFPHAQKVKQLIFSKDYDRLPRLFLGQSFFVVTSTFLISGLTSFVYWPTGYMGLPEWFITLCFRSGLCGMILTVNIFQLLPSLYAQKHPREFLEYVPAIYSTIISSLFVESLGILHATFLIVSFLEDYVISTGAKWQVGSGIFGTQLSKFSDLCTTLSFVSAAKADTSDITSRSTRVSTSEWSSTEVNMNVLHMDPSVQEGVAARGGILPMEELKDFGEFGDPNRGEEQLNIHEMELENKKHLNWNFKMKVIGSTFIALGCFFFLMVSLFQSRSTVNLHPALLLLILLVVYFIVFLCEGLKVAICSTANMTTEDLQNRGITTSIHEILASRSGTTSEGIGNFLLGRQLIVVPLNFVIANIFAFQGYEDMPDLLYALIIGFSLPSVIFTMQIIQLAPQVFAGRHTDSFLRLPGATWIVHCALSIEKLGLTKTAHGLVDAVSNSRFFCNAGDRNHVNVPLGLDYSEGGLPMDSSMSGIMNTNSGSTMHLEMEFNKTDHLDMEFVQVDKTFEEAENK